MRRHVHEEHANHEAWAIPYGDLVTLLLALFVVLYSMSSVNEGKYRVLSDSLNAAFGGKPRSPLPIPIGDHAQTGSTPALVSVLPKPGGGRDAGARQLSTVQTPLPSHGKPAEGRRDIRQMAEALRAAMGDLIDRREVVIRAGADQLEIEIRADILFPSGVADISAAAQPVLRRVSAILAPFPNAIRVEGHTDNLPIATATYPSNWQLSSARAASVVKLFMDHGVAPTRMSIAGYGEYYPKASNATAEGRNANRRVLVVVLGDAAVARDADAAARSEARPEARTEAASEPQAQPEPAPAAAAGRPPATLAPPETRVAAAAAAGSSAAESLPAPPVPPIDSGPPLDQLLDAEQLPHQSWSPTP